MYKCFNFSVHVLVSLNILILNKNKLESKSWVGIRIGIIGEKQVFVEENVIAETKGRSNGSGLRLQHF